MAAPAFVSIGAQLQSSTASPSIAAPAGLSGATDQIVVITFLIDSTQTITGLPTGFNRCAAMPQTITGAGAHSQDKFWGRASDIGAGPFVFTASGSTYFNGAAELFSGCTTSGDPWDTGAGAPSGAQTSGVNGTVSPDVSLTTQGADRLLCWSATNWSGGNWTPPTSFTERRDTGDKNCTSADMTFPTAGATGAISGSCAGNDKRTAWLGALIPPSGGAGPSQGSVDVGLGLAVAATGARDAEGAAAVGLGLAVAGAGSRAARGVAVVGLGLAVSGSGSAIDPHEGSAALALGLAVSAAGSAAEPNAGSVALTLGLAVAATGAQEAVVTPEAPVANGWAGLLGIGQEARQLWREAQKDKPVDCWNDGEPLLDGHCRYCGRIYP